MFNLDESTPIQNNVKLMFIEEVGSGYWAFFFLRVAKFSKGRIVNVALLDGRVPTTSRTSIIMKDGDVSSVRFFTRKVKENNIKNSSTPDIHIWVASGVIVPSITLNKKRMKIRGLSVIYVASLVFPELSDV